jgi:CRISPR-associated protein Cmr3
MANYQIKLTPVDSFFFGGEKHIEKGGKLESNYFVESNLYPQQTTLLGLLRYYLLLKNPKVFSNNKINNQTDATNIIGPSSFDYHKTPDNYGKILSVGPLYFQNKTKNYFFAPLDIDFEMDGFQLIKKKDGKKTDYNAKDHYYDICQYLINSGGTKLKLSEIISDVQQVGNEKTRKGEDKDNKFYKQNAKRMQNDWSFCFDADISDGANVPDKDELFIPFGGEKSFFKMKVKKQKPASFTIPNNYKRVEHFILCISDCFVSSDIITNCQLSINRYVSFRNIKTIVKQTMKYSGFSQSDPLQPKRSNRFNLLQRGSILYFEKKTKMEEAKKMIEANDKKHCITIGFNKIITK